MACDVSLLGLAVLLDEVAPQALGIDGGFLDCPASGGVPGLRDRVALIEEHFQERIGFLVVRRPASDCSRGST